LKEISKIVTSQDQTGLTCAIFGLIWQSPLCLTLSCCLNYSHNKRITEELNVKKQTMNITQCVVCYSFLSVDVEDPAPKAARGVQVVPEPTPGTEIRPAVETGMEMSAR
jgi:hypothetical protein